MREYKTRAAELSRYRYEKASAYLKTARLLYDAEDYLSANNRAYYAIYHCLRAVLALDEFDSKKHSGIIAQFRKEYIKTGIFAAEISDMIKDAFEIRNNSDYEDMYIASKSQTLTQIQNAEYVSSAVKKYLVEEKVLSEQ